MTSSTVFSMHDPVIESRHMVRPKDVRCIACGASSVEPFCKKCTCVNRNKFKLHKCLTEIMKGQHDGTAQDHARAALDAARATIIT